MLARVYTCAVIGLDGVVVEVEVDYTQGLPGMTVVGLPDAAVQESRERVQAAVRNAGVPLPRKRLVVNLAPASVRKEGPSYDLPIALGVLIYTGMLLPEAAEGMLVIAAPTLVKMLPLPLKRMIGDMSDEERVLLGLGVSASSTEDLDK